VFNADEASYPKENEDGANVVVVGAAVVVVVVVVVVVGVSLPPIQLLLPLPKFCIVAPAGADILPG